MERRNEEKRQERGKRAAEKKDRAVVIEASLRVVSSALMSSAAGCPSYMWRTDQRRQSRDRFMRPVSKAVVRSAVWSLRTRKTVSLKLFDFSFFNRRVQSRASCKQAYTFPAARKTGEQGESRSYTRRRKRRKAGQCFTCALLIVFLPQQPSRVRQAEALQRSLLYRLLSRKQEFSRSAMPMDTKGYTSPH